MPNRALFRAVLVILLALAAPAVRVHAEDWRVLDEHWYAIELAGSRIGHAHECTEQDGDRIRLTTTSSMVMKRLDAEVAIGITQLSIEGDDGAPIMLTSITDMSKQIKSSTLHFNGDTVNLVTRDGGRERSVDRPAPAGDWLMPYASRLFQRERLKAGATSIEYQTLSLENGLDPIVIRMKRIGTEEAMVDDREIPVTRWSIESTDMPGIPMSATYSADGVMVEQTMTMPIGAMVSRLTTKADAVGGEIVAPELMLTNFVALDQPLSGLDRRRSITFDVRTKDGSKVELPTAGAQRITMNPDGTSARVTVSLDDPVPATDAERADAAYLSASSMIDADDPLIEALARKATRRTSEDPMLRAEAMRALVAKHISRKGYETAFASASETAKLRTGDCSEHAMLLAAMLRADDIPSRVADGLVYVEGLGPSPAAFGWHMWTQALIDGKWIDLDATLPVPYHVGHLLTGTSALRDDGAGDMQMHLLKLLGNLEIRVAERAGD
ncbi:MAG: transglutaminase domain-containing protein [Phycisphaerales bacterium]|nr:transglutaminase domain-containing protein [Phycisphaerales bacterium]